MRSSFRAKFDKFTIGFENTFRKYKYRRTAKIRLKRMNGGYSCDKDYRDIVVPYWNKFGKKPKKYWYNIFSDREKKVDPRYIPDDIFYGEIIPYYNNVQFRRAYEDKCVYNVIFPNVNKPKTVCKNIAGIYYDSDMNIITKEEAVKLCLKCNNNFFIKPSIDSGEGRLIQFFDKDILDKEKLIDEINNIKANFIIQEEVKQHEILSSLNFSSLNSIRVLSFLFEGEVYILSSILRVGAEGSKVDNIGAGGFACPIKNDGWLKDKAVNRKAKWVSENNNGIKFSSIQVPSYDKIIGIIKQEHKKLPHSKIIGWDFSVSEDGNPVFIEYNQCPGTNQITCGPTFGDLTEKVLEDVFINKSLKYAQN